MLYNGTYLYDIDRSDSTYRLVLYFGMVLYEIDSVNFNATWY